MSAELATTQAPLSAEIVHSLVTKGDVSLLNAQQRAEYYIQLCERVGLDPATQPFLFIRLNGKEVPYATKGAGDQLRRKHLISVTITAREKMDDVYYVTARAVMPDGRTDESQGAVSIAGLKGENLANAVMKAETKAKRRVTLSIVGLGMLDESELDTIQDKFDRLPPEHPSHVAKAAATVVSLPQPKIGVARAAAAEATQPRRAERQGEGLPDRWSPKEAIPVAIRMWLTPLSQLEKPLPELTVDELDLVTEQCATAYERAKANPKTTEKLLALLNAIGAGASAIHYQKTNGGSAA